MPKFVALANKVADTMRKSSDFKAYWHLADAFPEFAAGDEDSTDLNNAVVRLSNHGIIPKRVNNKWKVRMLFEMWRDMHNNVELTSPKGAFDRWVNDGKITVYRGVPFNKFSKGASTELAANMFGDFSLDRNIAIKFTQTNWATGAWRDEDDRNGYIYVATVTPRDIWMYNVEGSEYEVIVKGPVRYDDALRVVKAKIVTAKMAA